MSNSTDNNTPAGASEDVIVVGAAYDTPSDNYEEFDEQLVPEKLGERIIQTNVMRGSYRAAQFYDGRYLLIRQRDKQKAPEKSYRINLAWCSPDPVHFRQTPWKWFYASAFIFAMIAFDIFLAYKEVISLEWAAYIGTPALTLAIIFMLVFFYYRRDEYIFTSQYGGSRLFTIDNKRPDQQRFDAFLVEIQQTIERLHRRVPVSDQLVGELKMCRRLKDEGIISEQSYTETRSRIFKHSQYSG
jgi:hypothetical protein